MLKWQSTREYNNKTGTTFQFMPAVNPLLMNALVNSLQQKTELNSDQAQAAVEYVLNFLKNNLPSSVYRFVDDTAKGKNAAEIWLRLEGYIDGSFGH